MTPHVSALNTLIMVYDMDAALAFYRDILGAEVVGVWPEDAPTWVDLHLGGAELMLNTAHEPGEEPEVADPARVAAHADTVLYFNCPSPDDVHAFHALLMAAGWPCEAPQVSHYGQVQAYCKDADGYTVCFQSRVTRAG